MSNHSPVRHGNFDRNYFFSNAYSEVSFERFSQYWWSNRYYALLIRKNGPRSGQVLEIGCGLGHLIAHLVDHYEVYGSDINHWALTKAIQNVPGGNFLKMSAQDLRALPDNQFQIVIAKHVLEHLPYPERAIAEMRRVLTPGGLLLLATPNMDSLSRQVKKEKWVGYKDPTHINLWAPQKWIEVLGAHGFIPRKVFSDGFWDSPYVSWLPASIQKIIFGAPGGLQALLGLSLMPVRMGESLIILANLP